MIFKGAGNLSWELRSTLQICVVIAVTLCPSLASNASDTIRFSPLPKDEPYKLQPSSEKDSSSGLVDISAGIANILRSEPPYDIINDILSEKPIETKQILDYEAPMIVLAAFSLIFAVAIPIIGLSVCCCRLAGKCGGSLDDNKNLDIRPTKKRKHYTLALVFCSIFLIVGAVIILVSTSNMTRSLPKAKTTINNAFEDIIIYKSNAFKKMNFIVGPELIRVLDSIINEILELGEDIVNPIIKEGGPLVGDLVTSVINLNEDIKSSLNLLEKINSKVSSLVSDGEKLNQALSESKRNISDAKNDCSSAGPQNECNSIPNEELLAGEANFTHVPNITDTKEKVQDVVNTNLTQEANKGNKSFHDLPKKVQNMASNFTSDFKNFSSKVQNITTDFLRPLEDNVDEVLNKSILPLKDDINKYLKPDGDLTKYDNYRNAAYIVIGTMVFIMVFLTLLGIILGMVGASTFDTPNTRGDMSDLGGRILIGAAVFSVFCAFFINLLVAIVFLVGTNTSIVCRRVSDMELLKQTIDNPDVMDGYPFSKVLLKNKSIELTITNILNECGKNKAPWSVLKLDYLFNLTERLNYRDKIPNLDEVFKDVNQTVSDTSVMTDKARKSVNDSLDAGVQNINFTEYTEQTDKNIVQVSLTSFADNITRAAQNLTGPAKAKLDATAESLVNIDKNTVQPAKDKSKDLKTLVADLQTKATSIENNVKTIGVNFNKIESFIVEDAVRIAEQSVKKHADNVLKQVDQLLDHVISQVRNDIGRCRPIHSMYHSLTSSVCSDYFGNLNASWIGFGLCALFTLFIIILTVRAAKHFRRFHRADNFRDSGPETEILEMATAF